MNWGNGYVYFDYDPGIKEKPNFGIELYTDQYAPQYHLRPLRSGEFALLSLGPDNFIEVDSSGNLRGMPYDASNGLASRGDIVRR